MCRLVKQDDLVVDVVYTEKPPQIATMECLITHGVMTGNIYDGDAERRFWLFDHALYLENGFKFIEFLERQGMQCPPFADVPSHDIHNTCIDMISCHVDTNNTDDYMRCLQWFHDKLSASGSRLPEGFQEAWRESEYYIPNYFPYFE